MLDKRLLEELREYVEKHLNRFISFYKSVSSDEIKSPKCLEPRIQQNELDDYIKKTRKPTFNQVLFGFIETFF